MRLNSNGGAFARLLGAVLCVSVLALFAQGCNTPWPYVGGVIGVTAVAARSPAQEIEQVYYLGMFDPHEQVPSAVYRVTVRGQASAFSNTRFASGWVPAKLVDSLNSQVGFREGGNPAAGTPVSTETVSTAAPGDTGSDLYQNVNNMNSPSRRLVMFGPEGFRESPRDHRLVIVMGANPDAFFQAIDQALGTLATVQRDDRNVAVKTRMTEAAAQIKAERARLQGIEDQVKALPES
jgi:hypothetical protein